MFKEAACESSYLAWTWAVNWGSLTQIGTTCCCAHMPAHPWIEETLVGFFRAASAGRQLLITSREPGTLLQQPGADTSERKMEDAEPRPPHFCSFPRTGEPTWLQNLLCAMLFARNISFCPHNNPAGYVLHLADEDAGSERGDKINSFWHTKDYKGHAIRHWCLEGKFGLSARKHLPSMSHLSWHPEGWLRVSEVRGGDGAGERSPGEKLASVKCLWQTGELEALKEGQRDVISGQSKDERELRLERRAGAGLGKALEAEDSGSFRDVTEVNHFWKWYLGIAGLYLYSILPMRK